MLMTFHAVVNINALTPFSKFYYIVSASNSVGTTNSSVMTFMTNETGTVMTDCHSVILLMLFVYSQLLA